MSEFYSGSFSFFKHLYVTNMSLFSENALASLSIKGRGNEWLYFLTLFNTSIYVDIYAYLLLKGYSSPMRMKLVCCFSVNLSAIEMLLMPLYIYYTVLKQKIKLCLGLLGIIMENRFVGKTLILIDVVFTSDLIAKFKSFQNI